MIFIELTPEDFAINARSPAARARAARCFFDDARDAWVMAYETTLRGYGFSPLDRLLHTQYSGRPSMPIAACVRVGGFVAPGKRERLTEITYKE